MREADLCREILKSAEGLGLLAHWCGDSRKCAGSPGFPDLIIIGRNGVIFAEVKSEHGELTGHQQNWAFNLWRFTSMSINYSVWRPEDRDSGLIEEQLKKLSG